MKGGAELQKYVDLLVPTPAKLKIIHGEGPINLVGSHCVDYFGFKDEGDEDSEDEEEGDTEDEGMETEEVAALMPGTESLVKRFCRSANPKSMLELVKGVNNQDLLSRRLQGNTVKEDNSEEKTLTLNHQSGCPRNSFP